MLNFDPYVGARDESTQTLAELSGLLERREVFVIGVSGKKGSGKDTVGLRFRDLVETETGVQMPQLAFADALKKEASILVDWSYRINAANNADRQELIRKSASQCAIDESTMELIVDRFRTEPPGSNGWSRTQNVWWLLRYLGTDIRQSQDKLHWVKTAFVTITDRAVNEGMSTVITDVRFLHEAKFLRDIGAYVIRVDVSPETQRRRLMNRDGIAPSEDALNHASETQLDDYEHFNQRLDNNQDGKLDVLIQGAFKKWREDVLVASSPLS